MTQHKVQERPLEAKDYLIGLRDADAIECAAMGLRPEQAIHLSHMNSLFAYAVDVEGETVAVWGYGGAAILGASAYAWLLTTSAIEKHKFRFIRSSQRIVEHILTQYEDIIVLVHYSHTEARRWLLWLGFVPLPSNEMTPENFQYMRKAR